MSSLIQKRQRHGAQHRRAIRPQCDAGVTRRQIDLPHGDRHLGIGTVSGRPRIAGADSRAGQSRTPRVAHVAAQLHSRRTGQRSGDRKRRSQILLRSPRKGLAVARRKLHHAGGVGEAREHRVRRRSPARCKLRQEAQHRPGRLRGPQHPLPVVGHQSARRRRSGGHADAAQHAGQVDIQAILRVRQNRDIAPLGRHEAGQNHADRIQIRRQRIERETPLLIAEALAHQFVVAVIEIDAGAHLRRAGGVFDLTQNLACQRIQGRSRDGEQNIPAVPSRPTNKPAAIHEVPDAGVRWFMLKSLWPAHLAGRQPLPMLPQTVM